jgi:hypothetical protein
VLRYCVAVVSELVAFASCLGVSYRFSGIDMNAFKYALPFVSAAVVIVVAEPWRIGSRHANSVLWSAAARLAAWLRHSRPGGRRSHGVFVWMFL